MKTLPLSPESRAMFISRVSAFNTSRAFPIAPESFAAYTDGKLHIALFSRDPQDGSLVDVVTRDYTSPFAVALEAAVAEFAVYV